MNLTEMIDEVVSELSNWNADTDQVGTLNQNMLIGALGMKFTTTADLGPGLVECQDELIFVESFDVNNGEAVVPAWGRGQQGTVASFHPAGSKVAIRPRYPRDRVRRTLNQVLDSVHPKLFAVKSVEVESSLNRWTYPLPADVIDVIDIRFIPPGYTASSMVRRYEIDKRADLLLYPTGVSLNLRNTYPGYKLKVTYTSRPGRLISPTIEYPVATGLLPGSEDVITMGAIARLIMGTELARTGTSSVEQSARSEVVDSGSAAAASRYLFAMHQERLDSEARRLNQLFPLRLSKAY